MPPEGMSPAVVQDEPSPDHHQGVNSDSSVGWGTTPIHANRVYRRERFAEAARLHEEAQAEQLRRLREAQQEAEAQLAPAEDAPEETHPLVGRVRHGPLRTWI